MIFRFIISYFVVFSFMISRFIVFGFIISGFTIIRFMISGFIVSLKIVRHDPCVVPHRYFHPKTPVISNKIPTAAEASNGIMG